MIHGFRIMALLGCILFALGCAGTTPKNPPMNFHAQGTITQVRLQEIPSKARGGKSRFETWIEIQVSQGGDGSPSEKFAGGPELVNQFEVGQKVDIQATTSSGRHIGSITLLPD